MLKLSARHKKDETRETIPDLPSPVSRWDWRSSIFIENRSDLILTVSRVLWALVLVTLPVTSFRFMPFMGTGTYVRPLALYPLALLLPILFVRLKHGEIARPWPGTLTILLAFLLSALAATVLGATFAPIELRGVDFFDRAIRAAITLVIGLSFFVAAAWMNQTEADIKFSVKWLLIGLVAHLIWGAIQFIGLNNGYRKQLLQIQNLFSIRGLVKNKRISGLAYEPSWLAGQIATLYLPWLTAALLTRYRAFGSSSSIPSLPASSIPHSGYNTFSPPPSAFFRIRAAFLHPIALYPSLLSFVEPVLFSAAITGLLMTYSRSGLVITFLAVAVTFAITGKQTLFAFWGWVLAGFDRIDYEHQTKRNLPTAIWAAGSRIILAVLVLTVFAGSTIFLTDKGYIAAFFKSEKTDLFSYAQDVYLGPRLAYATAALTAFDAHPLTGVGLGASGFEIYKNMPDWVLSGEPEIAKQMSPASTLYPNPKNLYIRLITETGLLGFILFIAFYLALFADALSLLLVVRNCDLPHRPWVSPGFSTGDAFQGSISPGARWLAAAGIFALTAVVLQGVSQDSFAMPEMWINLGILTGATGFFKDGCSSR